MDVLIELLWAATILIFLAGAVTYAVRPHTGIELLKKSAILLAIVLIGPSLFSSVIAQLPGWVLVVFGAGASIAAY